jgi:hypothetical protein
MRTLSRTLVRWARSRPVGADHRNPSRRFLEGSPTASNYTVAYWPKLRTCIPRDINGGEVELRARTSLSPHSITGYEINFRCVADGARYVQIVRWNGPFDNFTYLANVKGPGLHNCDTVKATIMVDILTVYINGAQVIQAADNKFSAGSPGMGYYIEGGSAFQ